MSSPPQDPPPQDPQSPPDPQPPHEGQPGAAVPAAPPPWAPPPLPSYPTIHVPPGTWQTWAPVPPVGPRFDPADPLISDTYNGWWRRSLALLRAGWRRLALIHLVALVPTLAVLIPAEIMLEKQTRELSASLDGEGFPGFADLAGAQATAEAFSAIPALISMLAVLVSVIVLVAVATGRPQTMGAALRSSGRRLLPLIGWQFVAGLVVIGALLACILPVFYVGAVLAILPVVVALERANAVKRCFQLFNNDAGAALGRIATLAGIAIGGVVLLGVVTLVASIAIQGGEAAVDPSIAVPASEITAVGVVNGVLGSLVYVLSGILGTPFLLTAYADMRARREPFTTAYLAVPDATLPTEPR